MAKKEKKIEKAEQPQTEVKVDIPSTGWYVKTFIITLLGVTIFYYLTNIILKLYLPEPYKLRNRPPELTPWIYGSKNPEPFKPFEKPEK